MKEEQDKIRQNKALLMGTVIYAIGSFGSKFLNFLVVPLYTFYIEPIDLGDYDLLVTTVGLLSPLLTMKISDAAYRWIIKSDDNWIPCISATYQILIKNCSLAAVILLTVNQFVPIWNCGYFVAILIGDRILECLQKLLRGLKNQKLFAVSGLFHTAILVGMNILKICIWQEGVIALLQSNVISLYAAILLILILEKRLRVVNFSGDYHQLQGDMLRYSVPLVPSTLSWWVMSASDRYVIRWMVGRAANGIYSVAYKFPSFLQTIFSMFNNAWTDMALIELGKGKQSEEYTKKIFQQLYQFSFGMIFALIPFTKLVMKAILSNSYKEAAVYVGFLYLGTVFQGFSSFCSIGYLQMKKTGGAARTSVIGGMVNLGIDLLLIQHIGLFAACISTFVGFFAMWVFRIRDIKKEFPIQVDIKEFGSLLTIGILFAGVVIWSNEITDFILFCVGSSLFLLINRKNLKHILQVIRKKQS